MDKFYVILFISSIFVSIRAPDVEPPSINITISTTTTEEPVITTELVPSSTNSSVIKPELECPSNCTCTEIKPSRHCCPIGFYFNDYWNMCVVGNRRRCYRQITQQYVNDKYRTCKKEYKFYQGKCVKREGNILISCKFPQMELPCCDIEFPRKCYKSMFGEHCYTTNYYFCGEKCDTKEKLSQSELENIINEQMKDRSRHRGENSFKKFNISFL